jgi:ribosome biogenesis GTPase / thiamine phosphate phosphatase
MPEAKLPGRVVRLQSGFYTIDTDQGQYVCSLRGKLKRRTEQVDVVAVGDKVGITAFPDGSGAIESVEPRGHSLFRLDPRPRGAFKQILLANVDQAVFVFSCTQPEPHLRMLDRFLVIAEKNELPVLIVVNKTDLMDIETAREIFNIYPRLGYRLLFTSAQSGLGIQELQLQLNGKISALAGPSGVGKSSLLNTVQPGLGLAVREVNQQRDRGRHTTNVREMFPLADGGYVADLPGLRSLALWDTQPEELDGYFPELRDLVSSCQFNNCTHRNEPGCAVIEAIKSGNVSPERYESYLRIRYGEG